MHVHILFAKHTSRLAYPNSHICTHCCYLMVGWGVTLELCKHVLYFISLLTRPPLFKRIWAFWRKHHGEGIQFNVGRETWKVSKYFHLSYACNMVNLIISRKLISSTKKSVFLFRCFSDCVDSSKCCSYEYSPEAKMCNLNEGCDPTSKKMGDFLFCKKIKEPWVKVLDEGKIRQRE